MTHMIKYVNPLKIDGIFLTQEDLDRLIEEKNNIVQEMWTTKELEDKRIDRGENHPID